MLLPPIVAHILFKVHRLSVLISRDFGLWRVPGLDIETREGTQFAITIPDAEGAAHVLREMSRSGGTSTERLSPSEG